MSRRTPPAATEASCRSSPTRRTLAPRCRANRVTAASSAVEAIPASSTTMRVCSSTADAQAGRSWWVIPQTSLARVAAWAPLAWARREDATGDGASPGAGGGQRSDQVRLGGAQGDAARDRLQQGDVDVDVGGHPAAAFGGARLY